MPQQLTIGAFASRSGLSISALRFYDRAGVLTPSAVDSANGYRIYDEGQLEAAILLRDLRRLEMPLPAIQTFLDGDSDTRRETLRAHLDVMTTRAREAEHVAAQIRARITTPEGPDPMTTMTVDAAALAEAIDQITPAASVDPELPLLQTVLVEAREGTLRLVATDRYRLAVRDLVARAGDAASFRAVVARAALERIRASLPESGVVEVRSDEHALVVGPDRDARRMPAMPAEFPPYEKLFVLDPEAHAVLVDRMALEEVLADSVGEALLRIRVRPGAP